MGRRALEPGCGLAKKQGPSKVVENIAGYVISLG